MNTFYKISLIKIILMKRRKKIYPYLFCMQTFVLVAYNCGLGAFFPHKKSQALRYNAIYHNERRECHRQRFFLASTIWNFRRKNIVRSAGGEQRTMAVCFFVIVDSCGGVKSCCFIMVEPFLRFDEFAEKFYSIKRKWSTARSIHSQQIEFNIREGRK